MKNYKYYLLIYLLLWVVLFEFILPVNNILPKPSIVFISFGDLWEDYNLPVNYLSTITAVYLSLLAAYILVRLLTGSLLKTTTPVTDFIISLEWFAEFIPGIAIGLMLIYWFPDSESIEFVFAFATAFTSMMIKIKSEVNDVPGEYTFSALSLGVKQNIVNRFVVWKAVQPALIKHIFTLHFYIWSMLIAFEYIKGGYGLGTIFRLALEYKDLSALFSTFIITGITIYAGAAGIKYLRGKFFSWSIIEQ
ncbi:MAG: hypothetical protein R6W90_10975 [Ignavibacteriaceae bacterium]